MMNQVRNLHFCRPALVCITVAIFTLCCRPANSNKTIPFISPGAVVEAELAPGQVEAFQIFLEAGQYLRVGVQQQGIEATLALLDPEGKAVAEMESPYGAYATQSISILADVKGNHRIEVRASKDSAASGRFNLKVEDLRAPETVDAARIEAETAFMQARKLSSQVGIQLWEQAAEKFKEALSGWKAIGDLQGQATALYCMGTVYLKLDNMQASSEALNQALSLHRQAGYRRGEAYTLNVLGLAQAQLGNQSKSIAYLFQALPLWRAENDRAREATTLNILGGAHDAMGEPQKALEYYNQALEIRRALNDLTGQATTLNNIGVIYDEYGESQIVLDCYKQALTLLDSVKSPKFEDLRTRGATLNNIGYTYAELGDQEKALEYYTQALSFRREINDRRGEGFTLINIGYVYVSLGDQQRALEYYGRALDLRKEIKDNWGTIYTLNYIGQAHASLGQPQRALDYYNQALDLMGVVQDRQAQASLLDKVGQAYVALEQPEKALGAFNQALSLWQALLDRRGEATTLLGIARAERMLGRLGRARERVEVALNTIEFLRNRIVSPEARSFYFASVQPYYSFYIDLLLSMHKESPSKGFDALALQACERARARTLLETLAEARADIRQGIDQSVLERADALRKQINAKADYQIRLLLNKAPEEQRAAAEKDMRALLNDYQEVQSDIRSASPHYAALTQPRPLSVKEIQQQVIGPDTLLLEFSLGDQQSHLWVVGRSSLKSYTLAKREELEDQAERVYRLLTARQPIEGETAEGSQTRIAQADAEYWPQAAKLSQMLLGPVVSQLRTKRLLIVAEGALQYIPFSALPAPIEQEAKGRKLDKIDAGVGASLRPLILEHEIVYLPSISVLSVMRREIANRRPAQKSVAVFADPVFDKSDERVHPSQNKRAPDAPDQLSASDAGRALRGFAASPGSLSLPRLLSIRREAEAIIAAAKSEQTMLALDFDASLPRAMDGELGQYRIIHFATHGLLDNAHPELSSIVLSLVDQEGEPQDGLLQLHNIYNMNLSADLVVLSACDTGLGKQIKGEGLVGLTRGFMYAGAARVVASLWKVDSLKTEKLMKLFYEGMLVNQLPPLQALQRAQIEMWKQSPQEAPYYWAAFILQGEWK
jgi:CHAT domain-containing protein